MSDLLTCPLVTDYTQETGLPSDLLERLYLVRKWDIDPDHPEINPIPFKWPSLLRHNIFNISLGAEEEDKPLILKQYQLQIIHHLVRMPRFLVGDAVGLKKTCDVIAAICWLKDRIPNVKTLVVTTKSTTWQWHDEMRRFSHLRPFVMQDQYRKMKSYPARYQQLRDFLAGTKKDVLIGKYSSMIGARKMLTGRFDKDGNPLKDGKEPVSEEIRTFAQIIKEASAPVAVVFDEAHHFKGRKGVHRSLVRHLTKSARWAWGLTGTPISNSLDEFYCQISALRIEPFGGMWDFDEEFCIYRKVYVGRGMHKRILEGYKNVDLFKKGIRPFYLGRSQAQVKEPMPVLQTTYYPIDLDDRQTGLLEGVLSGEYELPPIYYTVEGEIFEKERDPTNMMTLLSVQQLVSNHWGLLDRSDEKNFYTPELSPKEEALLDLLDGDLKGQKVIVFTKFLRHIDRLEQITKNGKFTDRKFLRITGNEDEKQRNEAKRLFQENPDYDLIFVNDAGIEGLNLQQAAHMVCLDLPWSWGKLIQLVGRMVRSASPHDSCTLHILVSKGTIDEYTIDILKGKKGVFETILGDSYAAGLLGSKGVMDLESGMECGTDEEFKLELLKKAHRRNTSMKKFLRGERIEAAKGDDQYVMIFDKKPSKGGNRIKKEWEEEESEEL